MYSSYVLSLSFSNSPLDCRFGSGIRWYVLYQDLLGLAQLKWLPFFGNWGLWLNYKNWGLWFCLSVSATASWVPCGLSKHCSEWSWILPLQHSIIRMVMNKTPIPFSHEQTCREQSSLSPLSIPEFQLTESQLANFSLQANCCCVISRLFWHPYLWHLY